eukprot:gene5102-5748_t
MLIVGTRTNGTNLHNNIKIATWNVRGLKSLGKLSIVCKEMERHDVSILGLAEVHWTGRGSFSTADACKVIYSGKEQGDGYNHGVGIILNKLVSKTVLGYNPVNDGIITVRSKAHPYNVTVIQFYSPTSDATEVEVEAFYDILQETLDSIPNRDIKILMGDANAKIGRTVCASATHGKYGLGEKNEQGQRLLEFCAINNLIVTNTLFQHHPRRLVIWISPDHRTKNQIDYIMKNTQHQSSVRFDLTVIPDEYTIEISNRYELLARQDEEKTPNELWTDIKTAKIELAKKHVPRSCEEIEQNSKRSASRDLYKAVKNIAKRFNPRLDVVKDDSNNILTDSTDVLNRWKEYCEKLYENPNRASEHPIVINPITLEPLPLVAEVEKALNSLKNNKNPGYDEIPAELLKISGEEWNDIGKKIKRSTENKNDGYNQREARTDYD